MRPRNSWAYGSGIDAHTERACQKLMRTLTICISFLRACASVFVFFKCSFCILSACAWGTDACTDHAHQELMCKLSITIRNWCVRWAYESGTDACTEHMRQVLMCAQSAVLQNMLSRCIRDWCVFWAYGSATDAFAEHTPQELMRTLIIRNILRACSAYAYKI